MLPGQRKIHAEGQFIELLITFPVFCITFGVKIRLTHINIAKKNDMTVTTLDMYNIVRSKIGEFDAKTMVGILALFQK